MEYITAKKLNMSQVYQDETVVPVTYVEILEKPESIKLEVGDLLKVTGTSKGKGFQGVVKRHGFHGGPKSHGQKHTLRAPGSIGSTGPQRVMKGKKMAGRMGSDTISVKNLTLIEVDDEQKRIAVKGAIPGWRGRTIKLYK